uniref:Cyclin-U4-1 n=1 Tax=Lygus hesperus TaxID=30085 RepID=A0A0A9X6G0_LYGHE
MSVRKFVQHLVLYTNISPSTVLLGCLYLDRLLCFYPSLTLHLHNVFMLFMSCVRLASKVYDIRIVSTANFAKVACVREEDVAELEEVLLQRLHFDVYVSSE